MDDLMKADADPLPPVVLLVDNRKRDLDVATLIARQMRQQGIECLLEPLEAYRAVLAAYRPSMVIFNHLFASHLAQWSRRLHEMGVLTAVLSNEGLIQTTEARRYQSGRYHRNGHVDLFFCWNELHRNAVEQEGSYKGARIEVVGVPRFDFYFEPWASAVRPRNTGPHTRPRILICTNVGIAKFWDLPRALGDRHFAQWAPYQSDYGDYWKRIEAKWIARQRFVEHAGELAGTGRYDIVLRPHPSEDASFYGSWLASRSTAHRERVRIDTESNISRLILDCDLEIADESCTTGVESWIAGKPTVGLVMYNGDSPLKFHERAQCHVHCEDPKDLPTLVEEQLANPAQADLRELRRKHLERWCAGPDGHSCRRIAELVAAAVKSKGAADWSKLTANDYRRAAQLLGLKRFGLAYHFDPLLPVKSRLFRKRYAIRRHAYDKSIKPRDVAKARENLERALD